MATTATKAVKAPAAVKKAAKAFEATSGKKLPPMNDDLIEILSIPALECDHIAQLLPWIGYRVHGNNLKEIQAGVYEWMLNLYLEHGANWRQARHEKYEEGRDIRKKDAEARGLFIPKPGKY